jgi:hypothetical protein
MGASAMSDLPPGFALDQPQQAGAGLPPGFALDHPTLWDQVKSIPGGIVKGLATAASNSGQAAQVEMGQPVDVPNPEQSAALLEQHVTGALPSNGTYGRSIGEALGNPGNYIGAKLLPSLAMGAGSGLLSEVGGQMGGTPGRILGAIAGGFGGAAGAERALAGAGEKAATAAMPSLAERKAAAQAGYQSPEVAAVEIKPQAVTNLAASIENDLLHRGFRPTAKSAGDTFGEIRDLRVPQGVQSVKVADIDTARQALGNLSKEVDAIGQPTAEAAAARMAISKIDDFLPNLNQTDLLAGDAAKANSILQEARANYKSYKQGSLVDTKQANAELQAASTYGGGNINNATRQAFRPLLRNNEAGLSGFSPEASAQANQVVVGGPLGNTMRQLGRLAPTGPVNMGIHVGAALGTGGATIPIAVAAYGAKKIGESITRSEVDKLRDIIARQSPLYQQRAAQANAANSLLPTAAIPALSPALLRALLLSSSHLPQQPSVFAR